MIDLLEGLGPLLGKAPAAQRTRIMAIITQITTTGDSAERGKMLRLLASFDTLSAERRALSLASSSRAEDQLEGLEALVWLWRGKTSQAGS